MHPIRIPSVGKGRWESGGEAVLQVFPFFNKYPWTVIIALKAKIVKKIILIFADFTFIFLQPPRKYWKLHKGFVYQK